MLYKLKSNKYGSYQLVIYKDNTNLREPEDLTYDTEYFEEYSEIARIKENERDYLDEAGKRAKRKILEYAKKN